MFMKQGKVKKDLSKDGLIQAEEWIRSFEEELEQRRDIWNQFEAGSILPCGELCSSPSQSGRARWHEEYTKSWVYCSCFAKELSCLEQQVVQNIPLPCIVDRSAEKLFELYEEEFNFDTCYEISDKPRPKETLNEYLIRIAADIETKSEKAVKGYRDETHRRGLNSFLHFLRKRSPQVRRFINQMFPEKRDVFAGKIIRKIAQEVYPISIDLVRDILIELVRMFKEGNPRAKLITLESLALIWICLAASKLRSSIQVSDLYKLKASSIRIKNTCNTLLIPTVGGDRVVEISGQLAHLLSIIFSIPSGQQRTTIFQSSRKSLSRTLDRALTNLSLQEHLGNITYVTFMSSPHGLERTRRFQPRDKSEAKNKNG